MPIKPTIVLKSTISDEDLQFYRQMALGYCELNITEEEMDLETVKKHIERFRSFDIEPVYLNVMTLQKNDIIDLNLTEKDGKPVSRDTEIEKFIKLVELCHEVGIHYTSVAWQPFGVKSTDHAYVGQFSRGAHTRYVDINEIQSRPNDMDREYTAEEVWDNFAYFLMKVTPVLLANDVQMVMHPNDPPLPVTNGIASLVWNADDYRHIFGLDPEHVCMIKFCIGCWLEGGDKFGEVIPDITEFIKQDRVAMIHFRNVSSPMCPTFEETLLEDGYADMYEIMRAILKAGYDKMIYVDHVFDQSVENFAYPLGYMKGLINAIQHELGTYSKDCK